MLSALAVMVAVPVAISIRFGAWPGFMPVFRGLLAVAPVYWTVTAIEVLTYAPMLGSGGTYLAFVTGNITNLKAPAAISAMQTASVKPGTEEGEILSTIAIAVTSIVTTLILPGAFLFSFLAPDTESGSSSGVQDDSSSAFGALGLCLSHGTGRPRWLRSSPIILSFVFRARDGSEHSGTGERYRNSRRSYPLQSGLV